MNPLHELLEHGQSYWLDNLTRDMLRDGELERRVREEGLRGVTSNPSIFSKAISSGSAYDEQIERLVGEGRSVHRIYEELTVSDIRDACDVLRPVFDESEGADGFVSLEVSPYLARDTQGSIEEARRLFRAVDRPNVLIKIPGTAEGVPAIEQCLTEGINVNVTLLFSLEHHEAVARAYVRALETRLEEGKSVDDVASVASFFLSRIDVLVDRLLGHRIRPGRGEGEGPRPERLLGRVAVANAKLAYQRFRRIFSGERWERLASEGARVQRVLWASTSTKDPLYSDVRYVEPLIGPHTVNTMPDRTIEAFADHGTVETTVEEGLEEARTVLEELAGVGIDLDAVTTQLEDEGIQKFVDPFDRLMELLARQRQRFLGPREARSSYTEGEGAPDVAGALEAMDTRQFGRRLFERDPLLWTEDGEVARAIRERLGWLGSPEDFESRVEALRAFAREVREEGVTHVVLCGMGGSSQCASACAEIFGASEGRPELLVLDDTDPAAVRAAEERIDLPTTLFVVASKSGTTTETLSFYRYFFRRVAEQGGGEPGRQFVAITDPGTPLAEEAGEKGFRKVFDNPVDIGGRYSALSYFGLVPMALLAMDVAEILESARQMRFGCGPFVPAASSPGLHLGAVLGMWGREGRDKVTLGFGDGLEPFGDWVEQLIAESTGKEGKGLLPVVGEPRAEPTAYGEDRVFVDVTVFDDEERQEWLEGLEKAGHPVVRIRITDPLALGGEFFRWEVAVAAAGAILRLNPFDEPNVAESKENTRRLLAEWEDEGSLREEPALVESDGVRLHGEPGGEGGEAGPEERGTEGLERRLDAFLRRSGPGDYFALLPYFRRTEERQARLREIRRQLLDRAGAATTLGYGPRYLHSTGQLHKGGPDSGLFLLFTAAGEEELAIPGEAYGFATLHRAQALGDYRSLADHGRRVLRLDLDDPEEGLARVAAALGAKAGAGA